MSEGIFPALLDLHRALGLPPIADMPEKHWVCVVDDHWSLYINGSREEWRPVDPESGEGPALVCGDVYVVYNGWPAGIVHPAAGGVLCAGEAANEKTLVTALRSAATRAKP